MEYNRNKIKINGIIYTLNEENLTIEGIDNSILDYDFTDIFLKNIDIVCINIIGIKKISSTFNKFKKLQNINILESNLKIIKENTFANCHNLEEINIPNSVIEIGNNAFENCEKIKNIVLPQNLKVIGTRAFSNCKSITNIIIPEATEIIGEKSFYKCINLEKIIVPASVNALGFESFADCKKLKSIELSNNLNYIGKNTFARCKNLEKVIPLSNNFDSNLIKNLCYEDTNFVKILLKELFTNPTYFISSNNENTIIDILRFITKRSANKYKNIILENINEITNIKTIWIIIEYLKKQDYEYWKDVIDKLNERYKKIINIQNYNFEECDGQLFLDLNSDNYNKSKNIRI